MTMRMSILLPCVVLALIAVGCGPDGGSDGPANKGVYTPSNPSWGALERGCISTVDSPGQWSWNEVVTSRDVFYNPWQLSEVPSGYKAISTVDPMDGPAPAGLDPFRVTARATGGGITLQAGNQVAYLATETDVFGKDHSMVVAADGTVRENEGVGEVRFTEAPNGLKSVVLPNGIVVPVE
jgi:hypothetical protein